MKSDSLYESRGGTIIAQERIKVNIITGFLGVGKTTAIQHLLTHKPDEENWVVLVNEFGEIGLDATFFSEQNHQTTKLTIKQVAGGCMCCTQGPTTQVVLNQIIRQLKPDRLFIEPSGLGHPEEVLETLMSPNYRNWLDCRTTVTLVDPRHFSDKRYTSHEIFKQQCKIADVLVANKPDLYTEENIDSMHAFLANEGLQDKPVFLIENGLLNSDWLETPAAFFKDDRMAVKTPVLPIYKPVTHQHYHEHDDHWNSVGYRYDFDCVFDRQKLIDLCSQLDVNRIKVVANCEEHSLIMNVVAGDINFVPLSEKLPSSRIELIDDKPIVKADIKQAIDHCLLKK